MPGAQRPTRYEGFWRRSPISAEDTRLVGEESGDPLPLLLPR